MNESKVCRHEYVRIYQRRLKGLERRLVATKAYLPVGFKLGDFNYLSDGSYCFCVTCRKRLFPKRTEQEKALARLERKRVKDEAIAASNLGGVLAHAASAAGYDDDTVYEEFYDDSEENGDLDSSPDELDFEKVSAIESGVDSDKMGVDVSVEELEIESVDVADIKAEGVKIGDEDEFEEEACELDETQEV